MEKLTAQQVSEPFSVTLMSACYTLADAFGASPHTIFALMEDECRPIVPAIQDRTTGEFWVLEEWIVFIQHAVDARLKLATPGVVPCTHWVGIGEGMRILAAIVQRKAEIGRYRELSAPNRLTKPKGKPPVPRLDFKVPLDSFEMSNAIVATVVQEHIAHLRKKYHIEIRSLQREENTFQTYLAEWRDYDEKFIVDREKFIARLHQMQHAEKGILSLRALFVRGTDRWFGLEAVRAAGYHVVNRTESTMNSARPWEFS